MPITYSCLPIMGPTPAGLGAGDIVPNASAWWSLRSYSVAAAGNRVINLRRDSDQAQQDFKTLAPSGVLDLSSISSFKGSANLFVTAIYDQTGNGLDQLQATTSFQPGFTLTGGPGGSTPALTFNAAVTQFMSTSKTITEVLPATFVGVANHTTSAALMVLLIISNQFIGYSNSGNNQANLSDQVGNFVNATASDGSWHAVQGVINGASSILAVDATQTTGNAGSSTPNTGAIQLAEAGGSFLFTGSFVEGGYYPFGLSTAQLSMLNTNIHSNTSWVF